MTQKAALYLNRVSNYLAQSILSWAVRLGPRTVKILQIAQAVNLVIPSSDLRKESFYRAKSLVEKLVNTPDSGQSDYTISELRILRRRAGLIIHPFEIVLLYSAAVQDREIKIESKAIVYLASTMEYILSRQILFGVERMNSRRGKVLTLKDLKETDLEMKRILNSVNLLRNRIPGFDVPL
jgi:hypothetical protein